MSRLAVVGCEASGKTVFTASVADYFKAGESSRSCVMIPDNVSAHRFVEYTNYQMRVKHEWPRATNPDKTLKLQWSLRISGSTVANIEMLEFGGEVLRAAFREDAPEKSKNTAIQELMDYLSGSEFIVVTIGLSDLIRDMAGPAGLSQEDFKRDSEAKWVTRGLLDFVKTRLPAGTGVVIALTQADMYQAELDACGGAAALFAKSWPSVAAAHQDVPVISVSSVSKVSDDGTPVDGYSTEGVLPVMRAFAEYCVGGIDNLFSDIENSLSSISRPPENMKHKEYRALIKGFEDQIGMLMIVSGLTGDAYAAELAENVDRFVKMKDDVALRLKAMERRAKIEQEAMEAKRKAEEEEAARVKAEKEKAEKELAERRRREELKRAEDERIKAEKQLEMEKIQAQLELERQITARRAAMVRIALVAGVCFLMVCGAAFYFGDRRSRQNAKAAELMQQEGVRRARLDKIAKMAEDAIAGDVDMARRVVGMIQDETIAESDVPDLYKIYMVLANENDVDAMFRLGLACYEGSCGAKKSLSNAHSFFLMAKKAGKVSAQLDDLIRLTEAEQGDENK